ncbi:MAG: CBS domain-containing protein [Bacteroidales bacterium]|nr:CBS domain-containing protein [Bacteroidales bacterium]
MNSPKSISSNLCEIIDHEDEQAAVELLEDLRPADIAELYNELTMEQAKFLFMLITDGEKAADVVAELDEDDRERFLEAIPSKVIADRFILNMDSDDAADVMADISPEKQQEVLRHVKDVQQATDIKDLMAYDESSAGGLMGKEYISVNWNSTVGGAIEEIRANADEVDEVYYVYVVNNQSVLKGAVSLKDLILSPRNKRVRDIYDADLISVPADMPAAEVSNIANKYDMVALPVVDNNGRLLAELLSMILPTFSGQKQKKTTRWFPVSLMMWNLPTVFLNLPVPACPGCWWDWQEESWVPGLLACSKATCSSMPPWLSLSP